MVMTEKVFRKLPFHLNTQTTEISQNVNVITCASAQNRSRDKKSNGEKIRTTTAPTGSNVEEGDTWYDTDDNQLKVYRETSSGVFEWVPIMVGNISDDSDTLDAGAF